MRTDIGIDNGVTGAIAVLSDGRLVDLRATPVDEVIDYQSTTEHKLHRVNCRKLKAILVNYPNAEVMLERPMINAVRFKASISAARAFEATLIALEQLMMKYRVVSSTYWQCALSKKEIVEGEKRARYYLKKRKLSKEDYKQVYAEIAKMMYPNWSDRINSVNADAVLLAVTAFTNKL